MDSLIRLGRAFGCCWCWAPPHRVKDHVNMEIFWMRRLPIFWMMGSAGSGKTELADALASATGFELVKMSELLRGNLTRCRSKGRIIESFMQRGIQVPDELVIMLLKQYFILNVDLAEGFILSGFPLDLQQAKLFELELPKVNAIICVEVPFNLMIGRMRRRYGNIINVANVKEQYLEKRVKMMDICRTYEHKTIKVQNDASTEQICNRILKELENYLGFQFYNQHLIAKKEK